MFPATPLGTRLQLREHWRKLQGMLIPLPVRPWDSELAVEELGPMVNYIADEKVKRTRPRPERRPRVHEERGTVATKKLENARPAGRGRGAVFTPELAREMCTCGHKAGSHAALKYSCQAPGDHKGFCPCMRFLSAKEWRASKAKSA
jgi:hypothetical protein